METKLEKVIKRMSELSIENNSLKAEADALRAQEAKEAKAEVRRLVNLFRLNINDVFGLEGVPEGIMRIDENGRRVKGGVPKYRSPDGRTWSGVGKRPNWFLDALAAGLKEADLLINVTDASSREVSGVHQAPRSREVKRRARSAQTGSSNRRN